MNTFLPSLLFLPFLGIASGTYPSAEYLAPFWASDTMYNESVLMVSDQGAPASASLLFPPIAIRSVRNAGLDTVFREGVDWEFSNGRLVLPPGSKAASLTSADMYPATEVPGWVQPRTGGGFVLFQEGHYFHDRQLAVTYTHARDLWRGPITKTATANLPNSLAKLAKGSPFKIVLLGNSITAGYNASGFTGAPPFMPSYAGLVAENLKAHYASAITLKNAAVAGKDAAWGAANAHTLVTIEHPDLAILSFGMNDGAKGVPADTFLTHIKAIMADVKAGNPSVEFILIAPTVANPEVSWHGDQTVYRPKLQTLAGSGVELVDMTGVHQELLKHKSFRDMTGNNVNHPNDFLQRWYAQEVSGLLIESAPPASARSREPGIAFPRLDVPGKGEKVKVDGRVEPLPLRARSPLLSR
ncbi:MAG: hypothetical protein JWP91_4209 [Fibrobacteres bacterium]|nr:hypothetical protein [Fibrobacterota bacterium]